MRYGTDAGDLPTVLDAQGHDGRLTCISPFHPAPITLELQETQPEDDPLLAADIEAEQLLGWTRAIALVGEHGTCREIATKSAEAISVSRA